MKEHVSGMGVYSKMEVSEDGDYVTFEDFELATKARDGMFSQIVKSLTAERDEARKERDEWHLEVMNRISQVATLTQQLAANAVALKPVYDQLCALKMSHPNIIHLSYLDALKAATNPASTTPQPPVCKHCRKPESEHFFGRLFYNGHRFTPAAPEDVRPVSGERQEDVVDKIAEFKRDHGDAWRTPFHNWIVDALTTANARIAAQDRQITELTERLTHRTVEHEAALASRDSFQRVGMDTLSTLNRVEKERNAALAEVAELKKEKTYWMGEYDGQRLGRIEDVINLQGRLDTAQKQNAAMRKSILEMLTQIGHEKWPSAEMMNAAESALKTGGQEG